MPNPNIFPSHLSGDTLPAADWDNSFALVEASFIDHGAYIVSGLAVTIGTGLSVAVASGNAIIGADIPFASFVIPSLADNTTNHLYVLQNGTGTSNTTGTPPANSAKLGTCVTAAGVVSSVTMGRTSGRQQFRQPQDLVNGGPSAGTASAGHPDALNLANWNATDAEGKSCYGALPAGASRANVSDSITADVTVANTASETAFFVSGGIAGGRLGAGSMLRVSLWGRYSALVTDSFTLRWKMGGTTFLTLVSSLAALTDAFWKSEFVVTCRSAGVSGTVEGDAFLISNNLVTSAADTGTHTINTTIGESLTCTVQWSAASASDTITLAQAILEYLG